MRATLVVLSLALASAAGHAQPLAPPPSEPPATTPDEVEPPLAVEPTSPPSPPPAVDPRIEKDARVASSLARDGHCEAALEYGTSIEAKAPTYHARVFLADPHIAACIAGTAPPPSAPAYTPTATVEDDDVDAAPCRPATFYAAPSLFIMNGSMYSDGAGSSFMTNNEDAFHRIAVGAILRSCSRFARYSARVGATAVGNGNLSGFGGETELDYGVRRLRGGFRLGIEYGSYSRIVSAGPRLHLFDTLFLGVDAYAARREAYKSHGVMVGFGLEGRAGRWAVAIEAGLFALGIALFLAGSGPP